MGYALISGGGADGRYSIDLDYGSATRAALLARLGQIQVSLNAKIAAQQLEVNAADSREANALANLTAFQNLLISAMQAGDAPGSAPRRLYDILLGQYTRMIASNGPIRRALATLKLQLSQANAMVAYWNNFSATETRNAWCCDLTENATGYVATLEIPGEPGLILIAPGGRTWQASDGVVTARQIMSPGQAYLNAALLPGWQKFKPTYRWGTITAIDRDANTASVALDDAKSSAQRLGVNQSGALSNVPFEYMNCHHAAFEVGHRAVVKFNNADWNSPKIIGFLDNPRACIPWPSVVEMKLVLQTSVGASPGTRLWINDTFNDPCGLRVWSWSPAATIAPPATHTITAHPPSFVGNEVLFNITSSLTSPVVIWGESSSAYGFNSQSGASSNVVPGLTGTSIKPVEVNPDNSGHILVRKTVADVVYLTLPAAFEGGMACVATQYVSGGASSATPSTDATVTVTDVISGITPIWLASIGALPTVAVTRGAQTKAYTATGGCRQQSVLPGSGSGTWFVEFAPA